MTKSMFILLIMMIFGQVILFQSSLTKVLHNAEIYEEYLKSQVRTMNLLNQKRVFDNEEQQNNMVSNYHNILVKIYDSWKDYTIAHPDFTSDDLYGMKMYLEVLRGSAPHTITSINNINNS